MYFVYYIYLGILVLSIHILQQSQTYNLYLREITISPNRLKILTPHQGSGECSLLNIMILYIQETCSFLILKGGSFNNSYLSTESLPSKYFE